MNLGRIILYNDTNISKDLKLVGVSACSEGTSTDKRIVKKNIKLLKVESPLLDEFKDYFNLSIGKVDYKDILGTKYEKGKVLSIYSQVGISKSILKRYSFYNIQPKLYYENEEGKRSYIRIGNINHIPYEFDLKGMFNYLKSKGVILNV